MLTEHELLLAAEACRAVGNYFARDQGREAEAIAHPPVYVRASERGDPDELWALMDKLRAEALR